MLIPNLTRSHVEKLVSSSNDGNLLLQCLAAKNKHPRKHATNKLRKIFPTFSAEYLDKVYPENPLSETEIHKLCEQFETCKPVELSREIFTENNVAIPASLFRDFSDFSKEKIMEIWEKKEGDTKRVVASLRASRAARIGALKRKQG